MRSRSPASRKQPKRNGSRIVKRRKRQRNGMFKRTNATFKRANGTVVKRQRVRNACKRQPCGNSKQDVSEGLCQQSFGAFLSHFWRECKFDHVISAEEGYQIFAIGVRSEVDVHQSGIYVCRCVGSPVWYLCMQVCWLFSLVSMYAGVLALMYM